MQVLEHSSVGKFVAHITATDVDIHSSNNIVKCETKSELFSLNFHRQAEYILTVSADIDRESVTGSDVIVKCVDNGFPSKSAEIIIPVSSSLSFVIIVLVLFNLLPNHRGVFRFSKVFKRLFVKHVYCINIK